MILRVVSALEWFGQKPFAGGGSSLGLRMISIFKYSFLLLQRLENGCQLLSWCIAAVPIAGIATVIQALTLITLPTWSGGDYASPRFLDSASIVSAAIAMVPLLSLARFLIGPPTWRGGKTQSDGEGEEA